MKSRTTLTRFIILALALCVTLVMSACQPAASPDTVTVVETVLVTEVVEGEPVQVLVTAVPAFEQPAAEEPAIEPQPYATALPPVGQATPPADNFFQDYGLNPFVDTYEDHLSTFAIDVDTASYSVARQYVNDGLLPPPEAIRPEEFINYFDQGYPTPPDVAFGIYADGAPSPFAFDGTHIIRIGIQGYQIPEWERKPAALTFVIDTSGSMAQDNRLELVKQSLQKLVDQLRPQDTVAIIAYSTQARVVLYPTSANERDTILSAVYSLRPEDSTNAEAGIRLGYQVAWDFFRADAVNRIILCSDGVANVGSTSPGGIMDFVHGYVAQGITLTSVGVGMGNFNDVLLEQLADNGDGNYAYVDTLDEAEKFFVDDLVGTLQVIAYDAKVQVDFNADVVARYRLIGYENRAVADSDFRNDAVDAGEIGAGHSVTALYAVQFHPNAQGRIATVQLRWQDPNTREIVEINGNFNTFDLASSFEEAAPRYQLAVVVAQYAEILHHSYWAAETSLSQIAAHASRLTQLLSEDPEVSEFYNLVSRAVVIKGQ
ncbi:MAG: VWA domain-containing protein [Anaerolineales bacterium]